MVQLDDQRLAEEKKGLLKKKRKKDAKKTSDSEVRGPRPSASAVVWAAPDTRRAIYVLQEFVQSLKEMSGLYPSIDPKHSKWLSVVKRENGKTVKVGEVCVSMEVIPPDEAERMALGFGRNEPNNSPFCPPPTGRMQLSLNPFSMLRQFLGPKQCCKLMCCCCCMLICTLLVAAGPLMDAFLLVAVVLGVVDLDGSKLQNATGI